MSFEETFKSIIRFLTWVIPPAILLVGIFLDQSRNPLGHPKRFIRFRFVNWILTGLTYALSYMGRYNLNLLETQTIYDRYDTDDRSFSMVITVGFLSYGLFVIFNGYIVDQIGARRAIILGSLGSGFMNVVIGAFIDLFPNVKGTAFIIWLCIFYGLNNYAQTMSTCAIVKCGVQWYHQEERGFFSGVFGIVISFGFYLAMQVGGLIMAKMPLQWLFYIPGLLQLLFSTIDYFVLVDKPEDRYTRAELVTLRPDGQFIKSERPAFRDVIKPILSQPVFIAFAIAELAIGWQRDGITTWYPRYFSDNLNVPKTGVEYQFASLGFTVGGMFGSLLSGIASDVIFKSKRPPVVIFNSAMMTIALLIALATFKNAWAFASILWFMSFFINGMHGLICSALAMDFAGASSTGTAVGLLDGIQKLASAQTGTPMASLYHSSPSHWLWSLVPAALLVCTIFVTYEINSRRRAPVGAEEKKGLISNEE